MGLLYIADAFAQYQFHVEAVAGSATLIATGRMSLVRFKYFERVARLGSIRRAADSLHVAASAISRQISHLEQEFACDLFERKVRGMRLTAAGQLLLQHARGLLDHHAQAVSALDDLRGLRRGHVRVWSVEGMVKDFTCPVLARFQSAHPEVSADLVVASSDRIIDALMEDDADVGIAFNPREQRGIHELERSADPLLAVMSPRHPAARAARLSLYELARWPLAVPDQTFGLRHVIDDAAAAADLNLRPSLITNSIEALRSFARVGRGVTVLPYHSIKRELELLLLKSVPLVDRAMRSPSISICTRRNRRLPIAATELTKAFQLAIKSTPTGC